MTTRKAPPTTPSVGVSRISLDALQPDEANCNDGTERGQGMLEHSLQALGAGRSVLLDKHNRIIGGNKTVEAAVSIGLRDVIVVESDGTALVAVRRTDLDLAEDTRARELAIADNRVSEISYSLNADHLREAQASGVDLSPWYSSKELARAFDEHTLTPADEAVPDASAVLHCCPNCGHKWTARDLHASDERVNDEAHDDGKRRKRKAAAVR